MTTKLGRIVTFFEGHLPIELLNPLITWSCRITWQTKRTMTMPMVTKFGLLVTYPKGLLSIKWEDPVITWSCKVTWENKTMISSLLESLCPSNLAVQRLNLRRSLPLSYMVVKSRGFYRIAWQIKAIISPLPQCQWLLNLTRCWLIMRSSHPRNHMTY